MTERMSKITFRADDELIEQLEEFDQSKSEVMREALRAYLEDAAPADSPAHTSSSSTPDGDGSIDDLIAERVDAIIAERLHGAFTPQQPQDVNVNITLDGATSAEEAAEDVSVDSRKTEVDEPADVSDTPSDARKTCNQCGEDLSPEHVHCPNCGEKASRRVFCDCGDEVRSDWAYCPGCGRRTPAADVLDQP
jgi:Arc/MetJ-type ribon-helix-helix transcriptional regulator